jgi:hypothetical protein
MKKIITACVLATLLVLAGCTTVVPVTATSNPVGSKVGEATGSFLFGFIPLGSKLDMSIQTAAKNGGITTISTVDEKVADYFFVVKVSTVVTGE